MKSSMAGLSVGLVVLLLSPVAYGQAITARTRVTMELIGPNGNVTASHIRDGVYYRTSAGDTLTQYTTMDGAPITGELAWATMLKNGLNYQLDYAKHRAYAISLPKFTPLTNVPKSRGVPSSVEGIPCMLLPVYQGNAGTVTRVGSSCYSKTYNLTLKTDSTITGSNGRSARNVIEMYAIRIGMEPDPKLFDIPHNFTIYRYTEESPPANSK
ncbi:MAG: hypothetical protein WBQ34_15990 [Candidatus Acidiferrales bacterium]